MDRFEALAGFIAVVEQGSFASAARKMGVAPSSLTRQLDALEASLGTPLLNRSTRRVSLTEAGAHYYEDVRRVLEALESADRAASDLAGAPSGLLRVTMPVAFGRLHIAPAIPTFLRRYPGMRLDIRLTDEIVNLVEDRIDVAIRLGALSVSNLVAREMAPHRRLICASPDYLEAHGTPKVPRDLENHNCLVFDYQTGDSTWTLIQGGASEKIPVSGSLRANGSELLREAAVGGTGLILMPTWLIGGDITAGKLIPVLNDWSPSPGAAEGAIWAVYLPSRRGSKKLACFLDFLAQHFGAPPYWDRFA